MGFWFCFPTVVEYTYCRFTILSTALRTFARSHHGQSGFKAEGEGGAESCSVLSVAPAAQAEAAPGSSLLRKGNWSQVGVTGPLGVTGGGASALSHWEDADAAEVSEPAEAAGSTPAPHFVQVRLLQGGGGKVTAAEVRPREPGGT